MAMSFDELVNNMVNVSLGAAAMAADKGKELIDDLSARGAQARSDASQGDFARSMADVFKQAGGAVSDVTDRLSEQGATVAERILDELIVARVRPLTTAERAAFVAHVTELVASKHRAMPRALPARKPRNNESDYPPWTSARRTTHRRLPSP